MADRRIAGAESVIVGPDRGGAVIREIVRLARARGRTLESIAADSGLPLPTIRGWIEEGKEPSLSRALSLAAACGDWAVAKLVAPIGYTASPLDEACALAPMQLAATAMADLATIASAAADGRIDHTEVAACRDAADHLIATVLPLSSAGGAK